MTDTASIRTQRLLSVVAVAAGALATTAMTQKAQSSEWEFERERGGGYAQNCIERRNQRICAVVYCGRKIDELELGVTGWEPRGQGSARRGAIEIDGRGREVIYVREKNPITGETWRLDIERGRRRLVDRIKGGERLSIDIAARAPAFSFTLDGSNAAISQLERRCRRIERRDERTANNDAEDDSKVIRFGNDDFGFVLRFGSDGVSVSTDGGNDRPKLGRKWEQLARERVNRRRDRDVVELGRKEGRFNALRFRAVGNDIRMRKVLVRYGNGREHEVDVDRRLNEGDFSGVLELKGRKGRFLDRIVFVYDTQGRGPRAELEVWGRKAS